MKYLGFLALIVSQFASATSLRDVRLQLREMPSGIPGTYAGKLTSVVVFGDGEAVRYVCEANRPSACRTRTLRQYNAYQMDEIHRLIEEARKGKIGRSPTTARCLVAPATQDEMRADNGSVFLMKGNICTMITENKSPAAKRLVRLLESLR